MNKNYRLIKERPVGTIFRWRNKKLKVVKDLDELGGCFVCAFNDICEKVTADKSCASYYRKDDIDIHYKEVKNEN